MALISLNKAPTVVTDFIVTRLIPNAPTLNKAVLAGFLPIVPMITNSWLTIHEPMIRELGILNDKNQIDIDIAEKCKDSCFKYVDSVPFKQLELTKEDGDALIDLLNKYKD